VVALPGWPRSVVRTVIGAAGVRGRSSGKERVALCGERYEHLADRQALRAGHVASSLVLGGGGLRAAARARSVAGRELGASCGNGAHAIRWSSAPWSNGTGSVDPRLRALVGATAGSGRGTGRQQSAVSERFVYGTSATGRTDEPRTTPAPRGRAVIDGVHFGEHVVLAAVGSMSTATSTCWDCAEGATRTPRQCGLACRSGGARARSNVRC